MEARMTSALTPALSPRRGGIVRRFFDNLCDWIGRTLIRKTGTIESDFLSCPSSLRFDATIKFEPRRSAA